MEIGSFKKISVNSQSWVTRRGGKAAGGFIELIQTTDSVTLTPKNDTIRIGRLPLSTEMQELAIATKYLHQSTSYVVKIKLRCGPQFSTSKRRVDAEFFHSFSSSELDDPFVLGDSGGSALKFQLELAEDWRIVTFALEFDEFRPALVFRLRLNNFLDTNPRCGDWIEFGEISVSTPSRIPNMSGLMLENSESDEEIISPYVRIVKRKNTECLMTFSPVNSLPNRYNSYDLFSGIPFSRIYLNDPANNWYNDGIPGLGKNVSEMLSELERINSRIRPTQLTTFGASMGAYGAILVGAHLNAQTVIAINPELQLGANGSRSAEFMGNQKHKVADLYPRLEKHAGNKFIFFSIKDDVDKTTLETLKGKSISKISLHTIDSGHHVKAVLGNYQWLTRLIETKGLSDAYLPTIIKKSLQVE